MAALSLFPLAVVALILCGSLLGSALSLLLDGLQAYRLRQIKAREVDYRSILGRSYGLSEEDRIRPARVTYQVSEVRARLQLPAAA